MQPYTYIQHKPRSTTKRKWMNMQIIFNNDENINFNPNHLYKDNLFDSNSP